MKIQNKDLRKEYIKKVKALGFKVVLPKDGKSFDVYETFVSKQTGKIIKKDRAFGWGTCGNEKVWKNIYESITKEIIKNKI